MYFYPRPPCGGRPQGDCIKIAQSEFLSTPSVRRATLFQSAGLKPPVISIHALRAEGDVRLVVYVHNLSHISIHALRAEGDLSFLRTAPKALHFYPRPPCGGRLIPPAIISNSSLISIHALRAEGDPTHNKCSWCSLNFYPRPPCGGRPTWLRWTAADLHFYPRPPCGGRRPYVSAVFLPASVFLSTPSVRRATFVVSTIQYRSHCISIHALRAEGDPSGIWP